MLRLALDVIKQECSKHDDCRDCPLRDPDWIDSCMLKNECPNDWSFRYNMNYEESLFV